GTVSRTNLHPLSNSSAMLPDKINRPCRLEAVALFRAATGAPPILPVLPPAAPPHRKIQCRPPVYRLSQHSPALCAPMLCRSRPDSSETPTARRAGRSYDHRSWPSPHQVREDRHAGTHPEMRGALHIAYLPNLPVAALW